MKKILIATTTLAISLFTVPTFANVSDLPICPDKIEEQTCPCRPTATTEIRVEKKTFVDVKNIPTCPDSLTEQKNFGICRPTPKTEIRVEK